MSSRRPVTEHSTHGLRHATVADEAAGWLAALSDAGCTADERMKFAAWLRRSNLHVEEFLRLSLLARRLSAPQIWNDVSAETLIAEALASKNTVTRLSGAPVSARTAGGGARDSAPGAWARRSRPVLAAACVLAVALLFAVNLGLFERSGATYVTELGEQRSITLEDGSVVALNTQSKLRTRFDAASRTVELLQGEAVFKVAKNPQRPFRVLSGSSEIVAVGTAFNVYARSSGTVVTVLEGRVRVSHANDGASSTRASPARVQESKIELARGEQAVIAPRRPIVRTRLTDLEKATAWTERRLIFEETPLAAVSAEFARYYTAKTIRIADPALAQLHITGVFDASDPASLVAFLKAYGGIDIREDEHGWVLLGAQAADDTLVLRP